MTSVPDILNDGEWDTSRPARTISPLYNDRAQHLNDVFKSRLVLGQKHLTVCFKPLLGASEESRVQEYGREEAAAYLSHLTGLVEVPWGTKRFDPLGELVYVQEWLPLKNGGYYTPLLDSPPPDLREELANIAIFDVIIGNRDRRYANLLVRPRPKRAQRQLVAIDHGHAFDSREALSREFFWHLRGLGTTGRLPLSEFQRGALLTLLDFRSEVETTLLSFHLTVGQARRVVSRARRLLHQGYLDLTSPFDWQGNAA